MIDAIAIGVSAGGVNALTNLLPGLPADFRCAVMIVQHLPEDSMGALVSILHQTCRMPLKEAEVGERIRGGSVYLAPPGYHLLVENNRTFSLSNDGPVNHARPSIDVLFESAADAYEERIAGVILTGANSDGAAGLAAIKRAGGVTIVQNPETAESPAMPRAALRATQVDFQLNLVDIAPLLCTLSRTRMGDVPAQGTSHAAQSRCPG
ncbi:MAG: chemotaxis protein CheB [Candidatus Hydrogenedentes bacterium]|nr:chemotaxis protein CheB [Candidatus Hydrogenedentota bacterium]